MSDNSETIKIKRLSERLNTIRDFVDRFPSRALAIADLVDMCEHSMTDDEVCDAIDVLDRCIVGLKEIVEQHCDILEMVYQQLEKRASLTIESRAKSARERHVAMLQEDVEEEFWADHRTIEERFIIHPRQKSKGQIL